MTAAPRTRIVARAPLAAAVLGDGVGAVERVVERSPARIRGVQREARVRSAAPRAAARRSRRSRDRPRWSPPGSPAPRRRDSRSRAGSRDRRPCRTAPPFARCQSSILRLQRVAHGQQLAVARREVAHDRGEAVPEGLRVDAGARQRLRLDEVRQYVRYRQPRPCHALHLASTLHSLLPLESPCTHRRQRCLVAAD